MEQPDPRTHEYANKAGNPNSMGGHGQPEGRPQKPPEQRDSNHPEGNPGRAGLPSERLERS